MGILRFTRRQIAALALAAAILPAGTAGAAEAVDVELVLAVDVSGSVDAYEFQLQRKGYSDALRDPRVLDAIRANPLQRIAVTMVEWSGAEDQAIVVDWTLVHDEASATAIAEAILKPPRSPGRRTSISGGIDYAMMLFGRSPFKATRRVIDVSGDGVNNSGRPAAEARDDAVKAGVTINGLAILNDRPNPFRGYGGMGGAGSYGYNAESTAPLDEYFSDKVIGGLGAFLITAKDFNDFERAVVAKLVREIAGLPVTPAAGLAME
jgi:hypothetical protein